MPHSYAIDLARSFTRRPRKWDASSVKAAKPTPRINIMRRGMKAVVELGSIETIPSS